MNPIEDRGYVHPEVLVSTQWVEEHLADPLVRIVEVDEDPSLYESGHIPGAIDLSWRDDLNDPVRRDCLHRDGFSALMSRLGADHETTIVFYGDQRNLWAAYAFWIFHLFGHHDLRILDGGRKKWLAEARPMEKERPSCVPSSYHAHQRNDRTDRATRDQVAEHVQRHLKLLDVRSPEEFRGEISHVPGCPDEGAMKGGHIPGSRNIPWSIATNDQGEFLSYDELHRIYVEEAGLREGEDVIVTCRIGERSSHTWFALRYLLGFRHVRNYDGGWSEWGNLVGVPIERSA